MLRHNMRINETATLSEAGKTLAVIRLNEIRNLEEVKLVFDAPRNIDIKFDRSQVKTQIS